MSAFDKFGYKWTFEGIIINSIVAFWVYGVMDYKLDIYQIGVY